MLIVLLVCAVLELEHCVRVEVPGRTGTVGMRCKGRWRPCSYILAACRTDYVHTTVIEGVVIVILTQ